ncbi:MAG TPA: NERD domain-containing protein [Kribbella sp.]|nr:NERD domain-containing protein [Kribbella sp.]
MLFGVIAAVGATPGSLILHGYLRGLFQGAFAMGVLAAVGLLFLLHTGAWRELAGVNGEDGTRGELRIARRRRRIWGWIDNLEVQGGDVDHLVVTSAGVLVVDSKWHTSDLNDALLHADAAAAHRAARLARLILRSLGLTDLQIDPVVVVWGGAQSSLGHQVRIDGVEFVGGPDLQRWLTRRASGALTSRRAADVLTRLREFKARVDPTRNPGRPKQPRRTDGNPGPTARRNG